MYQPETVAPDAKSPAHSAWPRVTVIVPVYNQAQFVEETLDSVVGTGYPELEIVIVNDASRDGSAEVIANWVRRSPDQQVVFINHERNLGVTKTLNEAIRAARGEYICLLAGDDVLLPNGIADRVRYLREHPRKLAVFADCHVVDRDGTLLHESGIEGLYAAKGMRKEALAIDELMFMNIVFHWAVPGPVFMCRAEAFDVVGPYDESLLMEDWDMYLRLAAVGKLGFVPSYVARYRVHSASMCTTRNERLTQDWFKAARKHAALLRGAGRLRLLAHVKWHDCLHATTPLSKFLAGSLSRAYYRASDYMYRFQRKMARRRGRAVSAMI
jgi:glycosyltransferase involved in cell wall biosynthesis